MCHSYHYIDDAGHACVQYVHMGALPEEHFYTTVCTWSQMSRLGSNDV